MAPSITELLKATEKPPRTFQEYLDLYAASIGELVNSYIPHSPREDMNRYLYAPLLKFSQNGGKRHRPLTCVLGCLAVNGNLERCVSSAAAIEHFHTAALVHDDIADEAELRRNEPCLHLTEGEGLALNMGDLGLSLVNGTVINDPLLDDHTKVRIIAELLEMTHRTIEGQALDIGWARDERYDITEEDYLTMATHKTAFYSCAVPLAIGAIAGDGTDEQIEALRNFGLNTGLAFQIQDDLLNLVGKEEAANKDFRSDITEGKRTLVVVHALKNSPQRERLVQILSAKEKDPAILAEAVTIMEECGSIEYARNYAASLTSSAKESLKETIEPGNARDLLVSMADWFVNRLQ